MYAHFTFSGFDKNYITQIIVYLLRLLCIYVDGRFQKSWFRSVHLSTVDNDEEMKMNEETGSSYSVFIWVFEMDPKMPWL